MFVCSSLAGGYLQIPIFEYRSIYRLVPRPVQCCQLPCYHGRDPLPACMVLASNQVVRTRALVHAQTWSPMGEVPSALLWSSGTPRRRRVVGVDFRYKFVSIDSRASSERARAMIDEPRADRDEFIGIFHTFIRTKFNGFGTFENFDPWGPLLTKDVKYYFKVL